MYVSGRCTMLTKWPSGGDSSSIWDGHSPPSPLSLDDVPGFARFNPAQCKITQSIDSFPCIFPSRDTSLPSVTWEFWRHLDEKMAAGSGSNANENIPVFEYKDINTKPFHVGSFRTAWLEKLKPIYYSYEEKYEETEDADFAKEMGIAPETLDELKAICRFVQ